MNGEWPTLALFFCQCMDLKPTVARRGRVDLYREITQTIFSNQGQETSLNFTRKHFTGNGSFVKVPRPEPFVKQQTCPANRERGAYAKCANDRRFPSLIIINRKDPAGTKEECQKEKQTAQATHSHSVLGKQDGRTPNPNPNPNPPATEPLRASKRRTSLGDDDNW